jgi:selenium metabolism protein YedF
MTTTIDARGLPCPQPVILTRRAMQHADYVVTLVDGETPLHNITHMAGKAGWAVDATPQGNDFRIELTKAAAGTLAEPAPLGRAEGLTGPLVLALSADQLGRGEPQLGAILMRSFLHTLGEVQPVPDTVLLLNTGVKLVCEGSPVLEDLQAMEGQGVEILACGTCLSYFELREKLAVGRISNMYEIAEAMLKAGKLLSL